jgi:hypothetical protein
MGLTAASSASSDAQGGVIAVFDGSRLTVTTSADLTVTCAGGTARVNGADSTPPAPCVDVESIAVTDDDEAHTITLVAVTVAAFTSLTRTTIDGAAGNDTITGSGVDDEIDGGLGDDGLAGGPGIDDVTGGAGNDHYHDTFPPGQGFDRYDGGPGANTTTVDDVLASADFFGIRAEGADSVVFRNAPGYAVEAIAGGVPAVTLGPGADIVSVLPSFHNVSFVYGGTAGDTGYVDTRGLPATTVTHTIGGQPAVRVTVQGRLPVELVLPSASVFTYNGRQFELIDAVFQELLGRPADDAGLGYWFDQLFRGAPRSAVAWGILHTDEQAIRHVAAMYAAILHRAPEPAGSAFWSRQLIDGAVPDSLRAQLFGSDEYFVGDGGGENGTYIDAVYDNLLGRAPDPAGRAFWLDRLDHGVSRGTVAAAFLAVDEVRGNRIATYYRDYLERTATGAELAYWVAVDRAVGEYEVIARFLGSDEYYELVAPIDLGAGPAAAAPRADPLRGRGTPVGGR